MKLHKDIFDVVQSGKAIGANRPCGRVTIEPDWQLHKTETIWNNSIRGPFRYWQTTENNQVEVELPNIQSIDIERSLSQDIATCNIMMYNQWHENNGAVPEMLGQLGKPGFFWPDRGKSAVSQELWGQSNPISSALFKDGTIDTNFDWTNVIVPNGLIRTYQGYGGHDLSIDAALEADKIVITGVWLIDRITAGTDGMLKLDCRDMGRLLLEQMVYPPLVPPQLYPLEYYPPGQSAFDSPWGPRYTGENSLNSGISSPAAFSEIRCFYKAASTDASPGANTPILGHKPSDAADDNITNFALSQATSTATDENAHVWWEFWVGESYRADNVVYPPDPPAPVVIAHNTTINAGQSYTVNGALLKMQTDGNLVLYGGAPTYGSAVGDRGAVWNTGTYGHPGAYAKFANGILSVIYNNRTIWQSPSYGESIIKHNMNFPSETWNADAVLVLQADQNLVIYGKPDNSGNARVLFETQTWLSLISDPTIPAQKINSVSFKPWAGGYTVYLSVWNLDKGDWHTVNEANVTPENIPYAAKIDTALSVPDGLEGELILQLDTEVLTNRIRLSFSGPFYYSGQPDGSGNQYRAGLRTIKARSRGERVTEYDGDPNDLPWTYAFEAHPNRGYWVADRDGNVYGFGDAADYDSSSFGSANITSAGPWKNSVELFTADSSIEVNTFKKVKFGAASPWWNDVPRYWNALAYSGAKWITDNEGTATDAFADSIRWFKRDVTINGNAVLWFTCDNEVEVFVNDISQGIAKNWDTTHSVSLGNLSGTFELKFKTTNYADDGEVGWNPTALLWTLKVNGVVTAYSDYQTQVSAYGNIIVDIAATPSGMGYWLIDRYGQVFAFGDAEYLGQTPLGSLDILQNSAGNWTFSGDNTLNFGISGKQAMAIASTPTGMGYWVLFSDGHIYGFGDARFDKDGNPIGNRIPDALIDIPNWDWPSPASPGPEDMNPYRVILPPGPMTAPMEAQTVPYIVKVPERNALGYRLKEYPGSAYSWARRGTAICSHPTDIGFWATDGSGQVWAYGACESNSAIGPNRSALGDLSNRTYNEGSADSFSLELFDWPHAIESTATGKGYWIAFGSGKIAAFGDAINQGPIDIYKDNPQIKIMYNDDLGNDWTYERNQIWGLARNRAPEGNGKGFWVLQADGKVRAYNADYWGQPGYYGWTGLRWHDGNMNDYADIVKDLAAWCGFTAYDPSIINSENINIKNRPQVWGNIEHTGIYSDVKLSGDKWDKRTPIDCINEIKQIVGYNFWIEDDGRIRFEPPNWWSSGNFDEDGMRIYVTYDENGDWTRCEETDPGAVQFIPEIHESVNMLGYSATLDGSAYSSEIIVGSDQPDFKHPNSERGYVRIIPKTSVDEIRPGVPALRGIVRTSVWTDNKFINKEEQKITAELINLQIWFAQRIGSLSIVANPNLQINDQIRIIERNTSDTYIHYIRGISSSMNLDSGEYTMNLSTNRLGTENNWVITTSGEYNPMDQYPISEMVDRWQQNMNLGVTASTNMGDSQPTLIGGFVRR